LLIGIQQMIRHPRAVQLAQLKRGEARMERASGPPTRFASGFGATPAEFPDFAGPCPRRESRTS
jgi:hypothetical protein